MYGCESWTIKKAECQRIDIFELWCWRRLLRVPWAARRSNQSILKEISTGPCPSPTPRAHSNTFLWVGDAIKPLHPLSSLSTSVFNLSQHQGIFQKVSSSHHVARVLEFQLQHQSFQWIFRTDFFSIDWFDLLAVQGTLKSFLQPHSSKPPILQRSAFFTVQLSHPYMTTGKTIALTRWTFVGKVISLLCSELILHRRKIVKELLYIPGKSC